MTAAPERPGTLQRTHTKSRACEKYQSLVKKPGDKTEQSLFGRHEEKIQSRRRNICELAKTAQFVAAQEKD